MKLPEFKEIKLSEEDYKKLNRRSFIKFTVAVITGAGGLLAIATSSEERGMLAPLRTANQKIGKVWNGFFSQNSKSPPVDADGKPVRINGDIGMLEKISVDDFKLSVSAVNQKTPTLLSIEQLKQMPATVESFEFKCIEGWSRPVSCKGVRFSDLMKKLNIEPDTPFAGMTSINGEYYVSWDIKSLMHPQTILCYEMNGLPLEPENGAPVRILASVKYGVKQIKQLGTIQFTNELPDDYWAEQGYDDYLGL
jgi:DMSO/TMAO reductase YedYZ molybdopterin-dependent catalytic subunit